MAPTSFHGFNERVRRLAFIIQSALTRFSNTGIRAFTMLDVPAGQPIINAATGQTSVSPHSPTGYNRIMFIYIVSITLHLFNLEISNRFMVYLYEIIFGERGSYSGFLCIAADNIGLSRRSLAIVPDITSGRMAGPLIIRTSTLGVHDDIYIGDTPISNCGGEVQDFLHGNNINDSISYIPCLQDPATGIFTQVTLTFILAIEHENIFKLLVKDKFHIRNRCILFSLHGCPRPAQRARIYHLATRLKLNVYALCDQGPYGLSICSNLTYSASAPRAEEEFSVTTRILDLRIGRNQAIMTGGAFMGEAFSANDWGILAGLNAKPTPANPAQAWSPFLARAHNMLGRDNLLAWMSIHQLKYQLQHMELKTMIRQVELAIYRNNGI